MTGQAGVILSCRIVELIFRQVRELIMTIGANNESIPFQGVVLLKPMIDMTGVAVLFGKRLMLKLPLKPGNMVGVTLQAWSFVFTLTGLQRRGQSW